MAYTEPIVDNRVATGDNIYYIPELDKTVTLVPQPTLVTVPGTNIDKALLQPAFHAIAEHDTEIYTNIPNNIKSAVNQNPNGWKTHNITKAHLNSENKYTIPVGGSRYAIYIPDSFSAQFSESLSTPSSSLYADGEFLGIGSTSGTGYAIGMEKGSLAWIIHNGTSFQIARRESSSEDSWGNPYYTAYLYIYFTANGPVFEVSMSSGVTLTSLSYTLYTMQL